MQKRGVRPSATQLEALRAVANQGTAEAGAAELMVSVHTVRSHLAALRRTSGYRHLHQMILWAVESGWLQSNYDDGGAWVGLRLVPQPPAQPPQVLTLCLFGSPTARDIGCILEPLRELNVRRTVLAEGSRPDWSTVEEIARSFDTGSAGQGADRELSPDRMFASHTWTEWLLMVEARDRPTREFIEALVATCRRAGDSLDEIRIPVRRRLWCDNVESTRAAPEPRLLRRVAILQVPPEQRRSATIQSQDPRMVLDHLLAYDLPDAMARLGECSSGLRRATGSDHRTGLAELHRFAHSLVASLRESQGGGELPFALLDLEQTMRQLILAGLLRRPSPMLVGPSYRTGLLQGLVEEAVADMRDVTSTFPPEPARVHPLPYAGAHSAPRGDVCTYSYGRWMGRDC